MFFFCFAIIIATMIIVAMIASFLVVKSDTSGVSGSPAAARQEVSLIRCAFLSTLHLYLPRQLSPAQRPPYPFSNPENEWLRQRTRLEPKRLGKRTWGKWRRGKNSMKIGAFRIMHVHDQWGGSQNLQQNFHFIGKCKSPKVEGQLLILAALFFPASLSLAQWLANLMPLLCSALAVALYIFC